MNPVDNAPIRFDAAERQVHLDIDLIISAAHARRRRRAAAVGASVVAVIAVATVVPVVSFGRHHPPTARASAATVFRRAAVAAGKQPRTTGKFWYFSNRNEQGLAWQGWTVRSGRTTLYLAGQRQHGTAPGIPNVTGQSGSETWADLAALPTDTAQLRQVLSKGARADTSDQVLVNAISLLFGTPASPSLRSALFTVCATLPGIVNNGPARDAIGRLGNELTLLYPEGHNRQDPTADSVILDPGSGTVLQDTNTYAGRPLQRTTFIKQGWATSIGDVPGGP